MSEFRASGSGGARRPLLDGPGEVLLVAAIIAAGLLTAGTWLTGELAGLLFRGHWPPVSIGQAPQITLALLHHFSAPAQAWPASARTSLPGQAGFIATAVLVTVVLAAGAVLGIRRWLAGRTAAGFASRADLSAVLTEKAVTRRAGVIRPSLAGRRDITVTQAGARLGRAVPGGTRLAVSAEESVIVLAGPRLGKTSQVIIPWLADWPGPALVTSVRPDVLAATAMLSHSDGADGGRRVVVLDPCGNCRWPDAITWDPVSGCADYAKARQRAEVMVTVGRGQSADSTSSGFFAANAVSLLAGWLHAAACAGAGMDRVLTWAFQPSGASAADGPVAALARSGQAVPGIADMLAALYQLTDATRTSLWATVQAGLAPLLSPAARTAFAPPPGTGADLTALIRDGAVIHLIAEKDKAAGLAPVISAFTAELTEAAKAIADTSPGGRLDPPLGLFLDEAANIAPLPQLPDLLSYAGGTGIFTVVVLQSLAQARARWGADGAAMLAGAASVKLILGGLSGEDLTTIADLAGQADRTVPGWQHGPGGTTISATVRTDPVITPGQIRTLDTRRRQALVIHATTPAITIRMNRYYEGPRKKEFTTAIELARPFLADERERAEISIAAGGRHG